MVAQPRGLPRFGLAVALHVIEGPAHDDRELVNEGRLEAGEPVLRHPNQRRRDRLVGATLRGERDTRWRRDDHETRILIAGIVQRIETALDEWIVEGAD